MSRNKELSRAAMLRNINGLSEGDRAYCGPYGTVTCYKAACNDVNRTRRFKVAGNENGKLVNRGNYTMTSLRAAIEA